MSIIYLDTFFNVSLHTYYMVSERIKNKIWNDASKIKGKNPNTWILGKIIDIVWFIIDNVHIMQLCIKLMVNMDAIMQ